MMGSKAFIGVAVAYGMTSEKGVESSVVRGAGKRTFCMLKVAETLGRGGQVWIRLPQTTAPELVFQVLSRTRIISAKEGKEGYEKVITSTTDAKGKLPFFGKYSFGETVGLWLKSGLQPAASLLSPFISTEGFSFTPAEYVDLRERLQMAIRRYERLPEVSRGLEDLNTGFFRHQSLQESQDFIGTHLTKYLVAGDELHREYLLAIHQHARAAAVSRRAELGEAGETLVILNGQLEAARELSGRNRRKALQQLSRELMGFKGKHGTPDAKAPAEDMNTLAEAIAGEKTLLMESRQNLTRELQSAGLALSSLTVNPEYSKAETLRALEVRLQELIAGVDEAGLYQLPVGGSDAATTPRQLQQLENLLDRLRNTRHHLAELPLFYERRHFWYAQPAHLRRLLAPLLDLPTSEWEHAFTSWYFERCLEREEDPTAHRTDVKGLAHRFTAWERDDLAGSFLSVEPSECLHFISLNDDWPTNTQPEDLVLSLTGFNDLPTNCNCRSLRLAPLQDRTASHISLAGQRDPALLFTQLFLPLSPPKWRSCYVDAAPASSPQGQALVQPDDLAWIPLAEWGGGPSAKLNLYLPAKISDQDAAYLLENWEALIVTAPEIGFFHGWSNDEITKALLSDGFNVDFLCAALLRAAEAATVSPYDGENLVAMGREIRLRCGLPDPKPHPLAKEFARLLSERLPAYFFELHLPWRDTFLPLLATAPDGKKTVFLPNGRLPGFADRLSEARRQGELTKAGFGLLGLPADRIWANAHSVLEELVEALGG